MPVLFVFRCPFLLAQPNHRRDKQSGGGGQQRQPYPAGLARAAEVVARDGRVGRRRLGTRQAV